MSENKLPLSAEYYTLGCKLNFAETSTIARILGQKGIVRATKGDVPDICVINTCSVTQMADRKGRHLVRNLVSRYPNATIIVTGCYAQLKASEVAAIDGVDIVLGADEKLEIAKYIDRWLASRSPILEAAPTKNLRRFMPSCERGDRTRYFLKVQDGCDYFCTYCTIPFARGRSRSGMISDLMDQARRVAGEGGKEIVLTGVNIGEFGSDNNQSFFELLKRLDDVEGIERYRISSIEPNLLTPEIIEWVARSSRAFMPHFHIPLQSGSNTVLALMRRRYDTSLFAERVDVVRSLLPDAFIGVDVIAGARGETSDEWERSKAFIEGLPVTRLHVFPYSERPGTLALQLEHNVPVDERHRRVGELMKISDAKLTAFLRERMGEERRVLWEQRSHNGMMQGFTDNYVRVEAAYREELINNVSRVRIGAPSDIDAERLQAELID